MEKPSPTVLEVLIAEAKTHIVTENEDGTYIIDEDRLFDGVYYANRYPDVAAAFGTDRDALLAHYETIGKLENRFTSKEEEDAKILEEALARLPKEDPNANNNTQQAQQTSPWPTNQFIFSANGMTGTWDGNGHFNITNGPVQGTIVLPATIDDGNGNSVNLTLNMVNNQTTNNNVDASALNPSLSQMKTFVENQRNGNGTNTNTTVSSGITTVSYGLSNPSSTQNSPPQNGYVASVTASHADTLSTFVDTVNSSTANGIDCVQIGGAFNSFFASNGISYASTDYQNFTNNNTMMLYNGTQPHANVSFGSIQTSQNGTDYITLSGGTTVPGSTNYLDGWHLTADGTVTSNPIP